MRRLGLLFVLSVPYLLASPCATTTLASYVALDGGGCSIGPFTVRNFVYSFLSGDVTIADTDITVTPSTGPGFYQLNFTSPDFNISTGDSAKYLLAYTWDPGDIRSLEDILNTSTPVAPGFANVTTDYCANSTFGGACPPATGTLFVFHNGITFSLTDSNPFSCPSLSCTVDLRNTFELNAVSGGSSEIAGFINRIYVAPEPGTLAGGLLAGLMLAGGLRLKLLQPRR